MLLPPLAVNRSFMAEFIAAEPPCLALGLVEMDGTECALLALRLEEALPEHVSAKGFAFGHALLGTGSWEVVHFGFQFYGHATYNALINPADTVAKAVLATMVRTGDYVILAVDAERRGTTAFRSDLGTSGLAGLRSNMARIERSTTSEAQYRRAVSQFAVSPEPPGTLLAWACRGDTGQLDLARDRLVLNPA